MAGCVGRACAIARWSFVSTSPRPDRRRSSSTVGRQGANSLTEPKLRRFVLIEVRKHLLACAVVSGESRVDWHVRQPDGNSATPVAIGEIRETRNITKARLRRIRAHRHDKSEGRKGYFREGMNVRPSYKAGHTSRPESVRKRVEGVHSYERHPIPRHPRRAAQISPRTGASSLPRLGVLPFLNDRK
jgi:hypothetical protein